MARSPGPPRRGGAARSPGRVLGAGVLGPARSVLRGDPGRDRRAARSKRRRQDHPAAPRLGHHPPHHRPPRCAGPRRLPARGEHRLSPRAHRPRERLPVRRHPGAAPRRGGRALRHHRRVRRRGALPRHPDEVLLHRHVHAPGLRRGHRARPGRAAGGRGPVGERLRLPPAQPRRHRPPRPRRRHGAFRQPQPARHGGAVHPVPAARGRPPRGGRPAPRRAAHLPPPRPARRRRPGPARLRLPPRHRHRPHRGGVAARPGHRDHGVGPHRGQAYSPRFPHPPGRHRPDPRAETRPRPRPRHPRSLRRPAGQPAAPHPR